MYVCTIIIFPETIPTNEFQECAMQLMATDGTSPRYVIRMTKQNDTRVYIDISEFKISSVLSFAMLRCSFMFEFKGVYCLHNESMHLPLFIRIYSKNKSAPEWSKAFMDCEFGMMQLLKSSMGNIIVERFDKIPINYSKYNVGAKNLDVLQRQTVSQMLDIYSLAIRVNEQILKEIEISDTHCLNFEKWQFVKKSKSMNYNKLEIHQSYINCAKSCGRRRTITKFLESLYLVNNEESEDTSVFAAKKSSIVFTKDISKWQKEFNGNAIEIECEDDLDQITYEILIEGCTILCNYNMEEHLEKQLKENMTLIMFANSVAMDTLVEDTRYLRYHTLYLSKLYPKTIAPLKIIKFGCCIVDDYEGDLPKLYANWTFVTARSSGHANSMLDNEMQIAACKQLITNNNIQQPHPYVCGHVHQLSVLLSVPNCIKRQVNFIVSKVALHKEELELFEKLHLIQKAIVGFPIPKTFDPSCLLGNTIDNVEGCEISQLLERTKPMTQINATKNVSAHFQKNEKGTISQRIGKLQAEKLKLQIPSVGELSDKNYVLQALEIKRECQICFDEPGILITLCGHSFCMECKKMMHGSSAQIISCPICRSSLCAYDWITIQDGHESVITQLPTKIEKLRDIVHANLKRRRTKLYLFTLENTFEKMKEFLKDFESSVIVESFDNFDTIFNEEEIITTFIFACPPPSVDIYYSVIKYAKDVGESVQLVQVHCETLEDISDGTKLFLSSTDNRKKLMAI